MLQIVSIKNHDIICDSPGTKNISFGDGTKSGGDACAPDRFDDYDGF